MSSLKCRILLYIIMSLNVSLEVHCKARGCVVVGQLTAWHLVAPCWLPILLFELSDSLKIFLHLVVLIATL